MAAVSEAPPPMSAPASAEIVLRRAGSIRISPPNASGSSLVRLADDTNASASTALPSVEIPNCRERFTENRAQPVTARPRAASRIGHGSPAAGDTIERSVRPGAASRAERILHELEDHPLGSAAVERLGASAAQREHLRQRLVAGRDHAPTRLLRVLDLEADVGEAVVALADRNGL